MMAVEKKYKALRVIATLSKVLAFIVGGLAIIGSVIVLAVGVGSSSSSYGNTAVAQLFSGVLGAVALLIYGILIMIYLYGVGEFIYVFLDIEENTRITNQMLAGRHF
jgi:hypothetical protein